MRSYYDNQEHEIYMTKNGTNNIPSRYNADGTVNPEFKFYDWIELVPTGLGTRPESNKSQLKDITVR